ncbi:DUF805 domain-containing protein [Chitinivorax sp. B]|uniref:DUF805 domain-containing protein n=1 Tax=Chitinivorax sp. B TaxID=2502235 RepID=UPI001485BFB1|nr:DUF805 domain-containing protein [Chitinivorax sp. B]
MTSQEPSINPYQAPTTMVDASADETYQPSFLALNGRIGRLRYMAYQMANYFAVMLPFSLLSGVLGRSWGPFMAGLIMIVGAVCMVITSLLITRRRCHDIGWNGWTCLLALVPLINLIYLFIPGSSGKNQYGLPPKKNSIGVILMACVMPAILLVGVIAAIAIPAYKDYVKLSQPVQLPLVGQ